MAVVERFHGRIGPYRSHRFQLRSEGLHREDGLVVASSRQSEEKAGRSRECWVRIESGVEQGRDLIEPCRGWPWTS